MYALERGCLLRAQAHTQTHWQLNFAVQTPSGVHKRDVKSVGGVTSWHQTGSHARTSDTLTRRTLPLTISLMRLRGTRA